MPGILPPDGHEFFQMFGQVRQQARALATQQNGVTTNLQGQPILVMGMVPGSDPPAYGLQVVNQNFGSSLAFFGQDSNGDVALQFFDVNGNLRMQIDTAGLHQYNSSGDELMLLDENGITIYNSSGDVLMVLDGAGLTLNNSSGSPLVTLSDTGLTAGPVTLDASGLQAGGGVEVNSNGLEVYDGSTLRVQAGVISSSPALYGLAVRPIGVSVMEQVGGTVSASGGGGTATPTAVADLGVSVTATVGPSGYAIVTLSSSVEMNGGSTSGGYAYAGIGIDGGSATEYLALQTNLANTQLTIQCSATVLVGGLSAGSHTFAAYGWIGANVNSGVYGNTAVTVQPL